ncbi:DUF1796 family putative cysteine peptidase [Paenibacillus sp. UMB4589-SE434]|uniref:DUF1796 family putative cysteine peptidase n=1 Tax=Paenibacillus sp. UMB4589-SE434 TaxID=3046314 RepID=UPI00254D0100|nr:DUF1796 family putative cysteine peptidase [Paenibacillus sp. UMB4589-SE434]MDK8181197.1 DUF1796 family putative cysteine peptidase [Paenibacillus sp. UMB4589-SE434]
MDLAQLKGQYDAVYSLGSNCYPAQRLERYGLRPYSGVIDWMYSNSIPGLTKLLRSGFANFMHPDNMVVDGTEFNNYNYSVKDCFYEVQSVHDFLVSEQLEGITHKYPEFHATLQRRIARFLQKTEQSRMILFFRLNASFEEAVQLEAALAARVANQFRLLVVNPVSRKEVFDCGWPLANTCGLELPAEWDEHSDLLWNAVFAGITYHPPAE